MVTKALEILWNPGTDQFSFQIQDLENSIVITKRSVVSEMSRLFDPLGLLGPVVISARIFVQGLWVSRLTWDEELLNREGHLWQEFRKDLVHLKEIMVPRRVAPNYRQDYQLHCFCDASSKGYGCCIYVVCPNSEGKIESKLLIASLLSAAHPSQGWSYRQPCLVVS